MPLSISRAWDETRDIVKRDGKLMTVIVAALVMLPTALANLIDPSVPGEAATSPSAGQSLLELLMGLIMQVGALATTAVALRPSTSVAEAITVGVKKLLPALGAILLFVVPFFLLIAVAIGITAGPEDAAQLEARLAAGDIDGTTLTIIFIAILLFIFLAIRLALMAPVTVAESDNPLTIIKRSWALTRGHFWRLFAYVVTLGIAALLVMAAISFVLGGIIVAILGTPEPMNLSALFLGLCVGAANAALVLVFATMSARIYAQLVAAPTVPHVQSKAD